MLATEGYIARSPADLDQLEWYQEMRPNMSCLLTWPSCSIRPRSRDLGTYVAGSEMTLYLNLPCRFSIHEER